MKILKYASFICNHLLDRGQNNILPNKAAMSYMRLLKLKSTKIQFLVLQLLTTFQDMSGL